LENSIKIRLCVIVLLIVTGLSLLYLNHKENQSVFSYGQEDTSITIIDLQKNKNIVSIYFLTGLLLITLGTVLAIKTFYSINKRLPSLDEKLTKQEAKVVSLIKEDKTNKEIAMELSISTSTVKTHINNIYKKLEVKSRHELLEFY